jgi:ribosomal-protein-alanine N-acetyltransferase
VRESNLGAIYLYKKFGFEPVGLRKNYYPTEDGGFEHALLMNLTLNNED